MTADSSWAGIHSESRREREFQILWPATMKLWAPSEVRTNGMENRLVLDNPRERVSNGLSSVGATTLQNNTDYCLEFLLSYSVFVFGL